MRLLRRLFGFWRPSRNANAEKRRRTKELLEPIDTEELLRGWLLHAHKARDRHDLAARRLEGQKYLYGSVAVLLSAIGGSSVFASIGGTKPEPWIAVLVGIITITGAAAAAVQTFLDYPGRASRHQAAAVRYKAIIRELEQVLTGPLDPVVVNKDWIDDLRGRLDALEEGTPVVDEWAYKKVESAYKSKHLVGKALEALPSQSPQTPNAS